MILVVHLCTYSSLIRFERSNTRFALALGIPVHVVYGGKCAQLISRAGQSENFLVLIFELLVPRQYMRINHLSNFLITILKIYRGSPQILAWLANFIYYS